MVRSLCRATSGGSPASSARERAPQARTRYASGSASSGPGRAARCRAGGVDAGISRVSRVPALEPVGDRAGQLGEAPRRAHQLARGRAAAHQGLHQDRPVAQPPAGEQLRDARAGLARAVASCLSAPASPALPGADLRHAPWLRVRRLEAAHHGRSRRTSPAGRHHGVRCRPRAAREPRRPSRRVAWRLRGAPRCRRSAVPGRAAPSRPAVPARLAERGATEAARRSARSAHAATARPAAARGSAVHRRPGAARSASPSSRPAARSRRRASLRAPRGTSA